MRLSVVLVVALAASASALSPFSKHSAAIAPRRAQYSSRCAATVVNAADCASGTGSSCESCSGWIGGLLSDCATGTDGTSYAADITVPIQDMENVPVRS